MHEIFALIKLLFAFVALSIWVLLVMWICYNEFIHKLPDYEKPPLAGPFGIAPLMILAGAYRAWISIKGIRGK